MNKKVRMVLGVVLCMPLLSVIFFVAYKHPIIFTLAVLTAMLISLGQSMLIETFMEEKGNIKKMAIGGRMSNMKIEENEIFIDDEEMAEYIFENINYGWIDEEHKPMVLSLIKDVLMLEMKYLEEKGALRNIKNRDEI